jgi:TRAP-type C4-dicarboxylate transport system permease small subunit
MIAVLRSELHRTLTIPSSWLSMGLAVVLGMSFALFSVDFWSLFVALGVFGIAVVVTSQHYTHRTAVLLFLGQPRRWQALAAQCLCAIVLGLAVAVVSGVTTIVSGEYEQFAGTMAATPLLAVFGVASATVIRRPVALFIAYGTWFVFAEGLAFRFKQPLPFTTFMSAAGGNPRGLLFFAGYAVASLAVAGWFIRRDLTD